MSSTLKFILNGMPVRYLSEGAMSDIHIELTEWVEDLIQKVNAVGDFEIGNTLNPNSKQLLDELNQFINELDKYNLNAKQFFDETVKANPNITYLEMIKSVQEKFL